MQTLTTLLLKMPRNTEVTPEAAKTFLSALTQINSVSFWQKLTGVKPQSLSLEIVSINQQIQFLVTCDTELVPFVTTQIQSTYPLVIISKIDDPLTALQGLSLHRFGDHLSERFETIIRNRNNTNIRFNCCKWKIGNISQLLF